MKRKRGHSFSRLFLIFLIAMPLYVSLAGSLSARSDLESPPPLPKVWQIVWSDAVAIPRLQALKQAGFDGLFKCVAFAPNYPAGPIYAGGEWRLVERVEGTYDWSSMRTCLDNARRANMWFIPELVINVPPEWFVQRHPNALLRDSRGITATDPSAEGGPYLLSPWFIDSGQADPYLQPLVQSFLDVVAGYPNVPAIMIGNWKLNVLPWKMGADTADDFTYWPIWDDFARADYARRFGTGSLPPATWSEYEAMPEAQRTAFRHWLTEAMERNLRTRYLPWTDSFAGWRVINAAIWGDADSRPSVFTTMTPEMAAAKQAAIAATGAKWIIINDDNMGGCGLAPLQQQDIILAHSRGFRILGERVPDVCSWPQLYAMWANFSPQADGFINIGPEDAYWVGQFRRLYGPPTEPLPFRIWLPVLTR